MSALQVVRVALDELYPSRVGKLAAPALEDCVAVYESISASQARAQCNGTGVRRAHSISCAVLRGRTSPADTRSWRHRMAARRSVPTDSAAPAGTPHRVSSVYRVGETPPGCPGAEQPPAPRALVRCLVICSPPTGHCKAGSASRARRCSMPTRRCCTGATVHRAPSRGSMRHCAPVSTSTRASPRAFSTWSALGSICVPGGGGDTRGPAPTRA